MHKRKMAGRGLAVALSVVMASTLCLPVTALAHEAEGAAVPETAKAPEAASAFVLEKADGTQVGFAKISDAYAEVADGDTITFMQDWVIEDGESYALDKSITFKLNGNKIVNRDSKDRPIKFLEPANVTIDGTAPGSGGVIENNASYGFCDIELGASLAILGGTYTGATDDGALFRTSASDDHTDTGVTNLLLEGVTATTSAAVIGCRNTVPSGSAVNATVNGGTFTSDSGAVIFYVDTIDRCPFACNNVVATQNGNNAIVELAGAEGTFTDCTFEVKAPNSNNFSDSAIFVGFDGKAIVNGGSYTSAGRAGYIGTSGGEIVINSGTFSGLKGSIKADTSDTYKNPSLVIINGGDFTGALETVSAPSAPATIEVSDGTFDRVVPQEYCAEGFAPVTTPNSEGKFVVEVPAENVKATVGGKSYPSVQRAIDAAQSGQVVTLADDAVENIVVAEGQSIVLDLAGKTLTGALTEGKNLQDTVAVYGELTVQDSTAAKEPVLSEDSSTVTYAAGSIVCPAPTANPYAKAVVVMPGGSFVLESGILESVDSDGLFVGTKEDGTDASAVIEGGWIDANQYGIGVVSGASLTVEGGLVTAEDNAAIGGNGSEGQGEVSVAIKGGTIVGDMTEGSRNNGYIAVGVYFPNSGTLSITGGEIYANGGVGILARAGVVDITGGIIVASGTTGGKVGDSAVVVPSSGVVIDVKADYPGAADTDIVNVGGTAVVEADKTVKAIDAIISETSRTENLFAVSGGTFSSAVDDVFCAEGFAPVQNSDGSYGVEEVYDVVMPQVEGGSYAVYPSSAKLGEKVTIEITPNAGKKLAFIEATYTTGVTFQLTKESENTYSFLMPEGGIVLDLAFVCDGGELCPSAGFTDFDASAWYHGAIDWAVEARYLRGFDGTTLICPDDAATRAQIVMLLSRVADATLDAPAAQFSDVAADAWYAEEVAWAVQAGVTRGYEGYGLFGPEDPVTREQLATFLYRLGEHMGYDVTARGDMSAFADGAQVSSFAQDAFSWAVGTGIIRGYEDTELLEPGSSASRAEVATMLQRFCEYYANVL